MKHANIFDIDDPSQIKKNVYYRHSNKTYKITETIGKENYRRPSYLTRDEYLNQYAKQNDLNYFSNKADADIFVTDRNLSLNVTAKDYFFNFVTGLAEPAENIYKESGFERQIASLRKELNLDKNQNPKEVYKEYKGLYNEGKKVAKKNPDSVARWILSRLFSFKVSGFVELLAGVDISSTNNPIIPDRARTQITPALDVQMNLNVDVSVGNRLRIPFLFATLPNFNNLYLGEGYNNLGNVIRNQTYAYNGTEDQILQYIQLGKINFETQNSLVENLENMFGVKAKLKFGRLTVTSAYSQYDGNTKTIILDKGGNVKPLNIRADDYEHNKHFFVAQTFRDQYNDFLADVTAPTSNYRITRVEIWVTNRNANIENAREVIALADLGESNPHNNAVIPNTGIDNIFPNNNSNALYSDILSLNNSRLPSQIVNYLESRGLRTSVDFERIYARKIPESNYTFHPTLGYISLDINLLADDVLCIAYEYTYNGQTYKVGEFSNEVVVDTTSGLAEVILTKMLKATIVNPTLPIWDLMMKNVYRLNTAGISNEGFNVYVAYKQPSEGENIYIPNSDRPSVPVLQLINSDNLNTIGQPVSDGRFDFVEGYTVDSKRGRIFFPVVEPFGDDLSYIYPNETIARENVFFQLYDSIQSRAQQVLLQNRFFIQGNVNSVASKSVFLGAFNIPQNSLVVKQGGRNLVEGIDYIVEYTLGTLTIINPSLANSGIPITVTFQENAFLGGSNVNKRFIGARVDYKFNRRLSLGGLVMNVRERPFFSKVNIGRAPINNTVYGFDLSYNDKLPALNSLLDKLPFYTSSKEISTINLRTEYASFIPGRNRFIEQVGEEVVYIDDFENSSGNILLDFSVITSWTIASTPMDAFNSDGVNLFPEANSDNLSYNYNRARIAWYQIDPSLQQSVNVAFNPANNSNLLDPRINLIERNEVFPNQFLGLTQNFLTTFDVVYIPTARGPFNYNSSIADFNEDGTFREPEKRWAGIQRALDQPNFEDNNIEFVEFWVQDPSVVNPENSGTMYINLGNVSEDLLRDGRRFYENGMPTPSNDFEIDSTIWGRVPRNPIAVTSSFTAIGDERPFQDAGYDGFMDDEEVEYFSPYLDALAENFGLLSQIYIDAAADPSNDNFIHYRFTGHTPSTSILNRYIYFNNTQGNSTPSDVGSVISASTLNPNTEDNNNDNTLSTDESYYQYKVDFRSNMEIGTNYIIDKRTVNRRVSIDGSQQENIPIDWYLFRIPIQQYERKVGPISDFKSIRFMRMYFTGFQDTAVFRFAKFSLVRNTWRRYEYELDTLPNPTRIPSDELNNNFIVSPLSLEENDQRFPIPYVIPPGIQRQQQINNITSTAFLNEQSLSLRALNIDRGMTYSIFKGFPYDLRRYGQIKMFVHAEEINPEEGLEDDDVSLVFRFGSDYTSNFYEVEVPLKLTPLGQNSYQDFEIFREDNNLDFDISVLTNLKLERDAQGLTNGEYYSKEIDGKRYSVFGKPNIAEILGYLIGVKNSSQKERVSVEVWINELRVAGFDRSASYGIKTELSFKLSDLGTISQYATYKTAGFGSILQGIDERSFNSIFELGATANLELGKLLPEQLMLSIPTYAYIDYQNSTPLYDPFEQDILLSERINIERNGAKRNEIASRSITTIYTRSININRMRILRGKKNPKFWSARNYYISGGYTSIQRASPLVEENNNRNHYYELGYQYSFRTKFSYPLRKISTKSWLGLITNLNFNLVPQSLDINMKLDRYLETLKARNISNFDNKLPTFYNKRIEFRRKLNYLWNPTKSITIGYTFHSYSIVDEPEGDIDTRRERDSVFSNIFNGGRLMNYKHTTYLSYNLPLKYFPYLDWTTVNFKYKSDYEWISSLPTTRAIALGNTIRNSLSYEWQVQLNFIALYSKSAYLRKHVVSKAQPTLSFGKNAKQPPPKPSFKVDNFFLKILFMPKSLRVSYIRKYTTTLPGFVVRPSQAGFGVNMDLGAPGYDFVLGYQPDIEWLRRAGEKEWLTRSPNFNANFQQTYSQNITGKIQMEPIDEFNIQLDISYNFTKNNSGLFKWIDGRYQYVNNVSAGNFSMSSIFLTTHFTKSDNRSVTLFETFNNNRRLLSQRIGRLNPLSRQLSNEFYLGYNSFSQEVLIPAFIATYRGQDASNSFLLSNNNQKVTDNPFRGLIPLPNWSVNYSGLSKMLNIENIIPKITFEHRYVSKLNISQFGSNIRFRDSLLFGIRVPSFIDTISGNFIPYYLVPNVTIMENFSPLLGVGISTPFNVSFEIKYSSERKLSLSLINYQISETKIFTWNFNFLWTILNVKPLINVKTPSSNAKRQQLNSKQQQNNSNSSSLHFRLDFSYSSDRTYSNFFEQIQKIQTGGNIIYTISPSVTYNISKVIVAKLFYELKSNTNVLTSLRNNFHRAAIQIRYNLSL